jgi:hypothetical protein
MSGELNFMSMDLALYIASNACPRDNVTIPHEDVSLSNYVYSYTNNPKLPSSIINTTIDRIFVNPEHLLLTYNQSADWESRKYGRTANIQTQFRRYLWGHCNPRPMKNDELYTYFKQPQKIRKGWKDFVTSYFHGTYGEIQSESAGERGEVTPVNAINITATSKAAPPVPHTIVPKDNYYTPNSCAILFFGLPRSFKRYVLPSIIRNVIVPNLKHECDYYVHYYKIENEVSSRSGLGGSIDADEVILLQSAIHQIFNDTTLNLTKDFSLETPHVSFTSDTNDTLERGDLIETYRTTKDQNGNYRYFPYKHPNYEYPSTMDNIVKQWHSIDAVWRHTETTAKSLGKSYKRIAMLRSDVVYITPLDIYKMESHEYDFNNEHFLIPNWGNWPVNDLSMTE